MINKRISPDFITKLSLCEIFVFGSNLEGQHLDGAAKVAYKNFGAIWGQGIGLQGKSYAIPIIHGPISAIKPYVNDFLEYAKGHPMNRFLLTRIGCGIAGFKDEEIAPLFVDALNIPNISIPKEWLPIMIASPRDCSEKQAETPKVINEDVLKILCDEYKYIISTGVKVNLPNITIRYVIDEDKFGYANFGNFFFYGHNLYVFSLDDKWEKEHNQRVVIDFFRDECFGRGYARKVLFAGIKTKYIDSNHDSIYTGDVCQIKYKNSEYNFALGTLGSVDNPEYFRYAFVLDNHCLIPEDCNLITRVGTVLYKLDNDSFPKKLNIKCLEYNLATDYKQHLLMSKYTPSFYKKDWQYTALQELGIKYKLRENN